MLTLAPALAATTVATALAVTCPLSAGLVIAPALPSLRVTSKVTLPTLSAAL